MTGQMTVDSAVLRSMCDWMPVMPVQAAAAGVGATQLVVVTLTALLLIGDPLLQLFCLLQIVL